MHNPQKKKIFDLFSNKLKSSFQDYCSRHNVISEVDELITFLIDEKLIRSKEIFDFVVLQIYQEIIDKHDLKKTDVVNLLADRFDISSRTVWNILKNKDVK